MGILDGKAVVITGSGRGIGAACAKGAARQGAAVVVNDVNAADVESTVEAIRLEGGRAVGCIANVASWEDSGRLIRTCIEQFGRIDGLVNNAGLVHTAALQDFDPAAARSLFEVNVMGSFYCAAHAIKHMLAQRSGSIINVTSGAHMGMPNVSIYAGTKGAVASMVYAWAVELAGTGVRANGLSPVAGGTAMNPDTRMQPPEANSPVVEYLLSDRSSHVNGQIVRLENGELYLCTHPALRLPSVKRAKWSAEAVAEAFDKKFKDRLVPCGIVGAHSRIVARAAG